MAGEVSENQTIVESWTISALKAYLENKIQAVERETDLKFKARDQALKLQFEADQLHFASLNHEAARILKATEITVSRDTWDAFKDADRIWKASMDHAIITLLPRGEFNVYKETTEKALNLGAGKWQGVLQLISTVASFAAIVGVASVFLK